MGPGPAMGQGRVVSDLRHCLSLKAAALGDNVGWRSNFPLKGDFAQTRFCAWSDVAQTPGYEASGYEESGYEISWPELKLG